ncbi:hypothetical protein R1T16_08085 [Flavobacterium sp. DG1-102-2]|uniref:hypothetical protein n=1 Tax=Flavobacterium sp. DG1-102-2 TaxID=3081663 RepID=UPI00294A8E72|nr:hypothetical protein [Flavobacterium sp. DG1-102-2]MDV6168383.1 hypothetical protein [Flavobacterium sp. DG1-102-2]
MQKGNNYFNKISGNLDFKTYDLLLTSVNSALFDYSDHLVANRIRPKLSFKGLLAKYIFLYSYIIGYFTPLSKDKSLVISNAYVNVFQSNYNEILPPWTYSRRKRSLLSWSILKIIRRLNKHIESKSVKALLSDNFINLIYSYQSELSRLFSLNKVKALIVPNDLSFFENLSISIAKRNGIPTFVYLHGLPARYNNLDDNRADYLIVWGKGLKEIYVKSGVPAEKILTLKHNNYSSFTNLELRSNLENVLVLTKGISGTPCISSQLVLPNRSTILYYTELVKENLIRLGVKKATLRLHPSESPEFYKKNLTDDFFTIDTLAKDESLAKASLVVGPTSTMVLDALKMHRNYILFDPVFDGLTLEGMPLVSPFTGDSFIKLSNSFEEILYNINNPGENISYDKLNDFLLVDIKDEEKFLTIIKK